MKRSFPKKTSSSRPFSQASSGGRRFNRNAPKVLSVAQARVKEFERVWKEILTTQTHLDSSISKAPVELKPWLATVIPVFLRRPVSFCRKLNIPTKESDPWLLTKSRVLDWRPMQELVQRLSYTHDSVELTSVLLKSGQGPVSKASAEDFPPWFHEETGDEALRLSQVLSQDPPLTLRLNSMKVDREVVMTQLPKQLGETAPKLTAATTPFGIRLASYAHVLKTALFDEGCFEIQDEGSQFMSLFSLWPEVFGSMLTPRPGVSQKDVTSPSIPIQPNLNRVVIDACAGAGGKTLAMADALKGKGRVYAYDTSIKKLQALKKRAKRSNLNNIQTLAVEEGNERASIEKFFNTADVVLVDAPCSGWGVLRRNPDIKWRQKQDERDRMPELQARILDTYAPLVKVGGILVFGVCTFRASETSGILDAFLAANEGFELIRSGYFGPDFSDGFFMGAMKRLK